MAIIVGAAGFVLSGWLAEYHNMLHNISYTHHLKKYNTPYTAI